MLEKIVSGGQTGVDRAALDAAMALGIEVGGWCPKGRRAVDGTIPSRYPLTESPGESYKIRTRWNVRDSDATLIVCLAKPRGGTALTIRYCVQLGRPYVVCQLNGGHSARLDRSDSDLEGLADSLYSHSIKVLNVAGPRESKIHPIYDRTYAFLYELFTIMKQV